MPRVPGPPALPPPVYRPDNKLPYSGQLVSGQARAAVQRVAVPGRPAAPPVYRPNNALPAPPPIGLRGGAAQAKPVSRPAPPPVYRPNPSLPASNRNFVIQRALLTHESPKAEMPTELRESVIKKGHVDFHDKLKAAIKVDVPFSATTIHHKISQSNLKKLARVLNVVRSVGKGEILNAALALYGTASNYVKKFGITGSPFVVLNNMPLNLEYGPTAREHHMGEKFDPNVDTSEVSTGLAGVEGKPRPKLYRTLSARSIPLGKIDALILAMPSGVIELHAYVTGEKGTIEADLKKIDSELQIAIAADKDKGHYDATQWEKSGNTYLRATTTDVFKTWDPSAKPTVSLYQINQDNQLYAAKADFQKGKYNKLKSFVDKFDAVFNLAKDAPQDWLAERYEDDLQFVDELVQRLSIGRKKLILGSPKGKVPVDAAADFLDDQVEEAVAALKHITK